MSKALIISGLMLLGFQWQQWKPFPIEQREVKLMTIKTGCFK